MESLKCEYCTVRLLVVPTTIVVGSTPTSDVVIRPRFFPLANKPQVKRNSRPSCLKSQKAERNLQDIEGIQWKFYLIIYNTENKALSGGL